MYSLRLVCQPEEVELVSAELFEAGTIGIREIDEERGVTLIAGFESNDARGELLSQFARYGPDWFAEDSVDWEQVSRDAWQAREIGQRFLLAPPWSDAPTPPGRLRIVHNPGLACGTGEHPCSQLALMALEELVKPGAIVVDVGTGSGILAIGALRLGATSAIGVDPDCAAISAAKENFELNGLSADLACGSAECLADECADLTVANISGTVLLAIWQDLLRITRRPGTLILTGFPVNESQSFEELLPRGEVSELDGWCCWAARLS